MRPVSVDRFAVILRGCLRTQVFFLLWIIAPLAVFAGDTIIGYANAPAPVKVDFSEMKTSKGFGAQFWLTSEDSIFLNWIPNAMKNLNPVKQVRWGTPIYLAIFFVNPATGRRTDGDGREIHFSSIEYRWGMEKPDGTKVAISKPICGWGGAAPARTMIQLANGCPCVTLDVIDPPGYYTFHVQVHDDVSGNDIELERTVLLKE